MLEFNLWRFIKINYICKYNEIIREEISILFLEFKVNLHGYFQFSDTNKGLRIKYGSGDIFGKNNSSAAIGIIVA
jgi:hypothetical protein